MQAEKKYVMFNKENGARIECTEKYLTHWLARGFEVEEIKDVTNTVCGSKHTDSPEGEGV
ncbi:hypothetical protein D3C78_1787640 [compost metagenome]